MKKLFPYLEFILKLPTFNFCSMLKICLPLSYIITKVLQIFYSEIIPLTWYDLVNYNHTLYHSLFIVICPIGNFKETPLTHYVFAICKTGIILTSNVVFPNLNKESLCICIEAIEVPFVLTIHTLSACNELASASGPYWFTTGHTMWYHVNVMLYIKYHWIFIVK